MNALYAPDLASLRQQLAELRIRAEQAEMGIATADALRHAKDSALARLNRICELTGGGGDAVKQVEEQSALLADAMAALESSYSILGMMPSAETWNAADAADFFDGTYGAKMRQKFDDAWRKVAAVLARGKEGK